MIFGEANRKGVREVTYTYAAPSFSSINCISKKLPVKLTAKAAVICLYTYSKGIFTIFKTNESGIS